MDEFNREITKDIYDRAVLRGGLLEIDDVYKYLSENTVCGYGLYDRKVFEKDGKYYCHFAIGSSCD